MLTSQVPATAYYSAATAYYSALPSSAVPETGLYYMLYGLTVFNNTPLPGGPADGDELA